MIDVKKPDKHSCFHAFSGVRAVLSPCGAPIPHPEASPPAIPRA